MPVSVTVTKDIAAPPERVFELAADFRGAPERLSGVTKMEILTDGPIGVGTRVRETRVMFKREATEEMVITAFDPPRSYTVEAESHGSHYDSVLTVEPNGSGSTVKMVFEATPLTFMGKLMSFLMRPMIKSMAKLIDRDLEDIKTAAEA